jgi:AcrR family transcriptional regulator
MAGIEAERHDGGLRERKKQRTRETIARVAQELFAERGFHETTIRDIAEAADVSPRTVSTYFPVKEDLVFADHAALVDSLSARLDDRAPGETAIDALGAWIVEHFAGPVASHRHGVRALIEAEPALRIYERGLAEDGERLIARAVAVDLDAQPEDLGPRLVAAATMAALDALRPEAQHRAMDAEVRARLDQVLTFVNAGLQALRGAQRRSSSS